LQDLEISTDKVDVEMLLGLDQTTNQRTKSFRRWRAHIPHHSLRRRKRCGKGGERISEAGFAVSQSLSLFKAGTPLPDEDA
jgi:hypothetical protein